VGGEDRSRGEVTIVIDPGHGGRDAGVSGPKGILEKDLNLRFAQVLRDEAQSVTGLRVRLTRERDKTLPWSSRRLSGQGADIWLSLHHNADPQGKARGSRVFFPLRGVLEGHQKSPSEEGGDVHEILRDMVQTKRINESLLLAEHIQSALDAAWGVPSRPSRPAPLNGTQDLECPTVFVEVGFVSNAADRRGIQNPQKRRTLAKAILRGIQGYLSDPRRGQ
jgi:N-acetylmuramoyl-L-alanine amidase